MFSESARCLVVVGAQWGDEGKGKLVDVLAEQATIVARYQGGANAGHTVRVDDDEFILHLIPSGILYPNTRCLLGNGCVVDPWTLSREMEDLRGRDINLDGRLGLSKRAHLVLPYHRALDQAHEGSREGEKKIGTTGRGIGPAYRDKVTRSGLRVGDLADAARTREVVEAGCIAANATLERLGADPVSPDEVLDKLEPVRAGLLEMATDTGHEIREGLEGGARVLLEGAQGALLDIDHGTYPYVTSSTTTAGGAAAGVGIGPTVIDEVLGVVKAYTTRVGNGPLPTELRGDEAERLRQLGGEFGATTGRPRRPGWFDASVVRYAAGVNGLTALAVTKLDVLDTFDEILVATGYELDGAPVGPFPDSVDDLGRVAPVYARQNGWGTPTTECREWDDLPDEARGYLRRLELESTVPIRYVSIGAARSQIIRIAAGGVAALS
ncbi:MAG: adenylosuccinate synthase [Gemmatimonadota bacterium]|nr:adenylosuccinate synthase [Gemmatimonadota bacterium]